MAGNVNNVYILTPPELAVIAAAKGIDGILSLQETEIEMDENIVFQCLNHLYQQDIIRNSVEDGFILNEDLEKIMTVISQAHRVILVRHFTQAIGLKTIFVGNGLAAVEQSMDNINSIRLYEIPEKELAVFLEGDIRNKEKSYKKVLDEEQLLYEILKKPFVLQDRELDSLGNAIVMLERMDRKNNQVDCRILIKQEEKEKKLFCFKQEKQVLSIFQEEEFEDVVVDIVREALYDFG